MKGVMKTKLKKFIVNQFASIFIAICVLLTTQIIYRIKLLFDSIMENNLFIALSIAFLILIFFGWLIRYFVVFCNLVLNRLEEQRKYKEDFAHMLKEK